jgi:hypothetical protein
MMFNVGSDVNISHSLCVYDVFLLFQYWREKRIARKLTFSDET